MVVLQEPDCIVARRDRLQPHLDDRRELDFVADAGRKVDEARSATCPKGIPLDVRCPCHPRKPQLLERLQILMCYRTGLLERRA